MKTYYPFGTDVPCEDSAIGGLCRDAVALARKSLGGPPSDLHRDADRLENMAVQLRDCFIQRLREAPDTADPRWRGPLDDANILISLIAAVEYPVTGIDRQRMQDALGVLEQIARQLHPEA